MNFTLNEELRQELENIEKFTDKKEKQIEMQQFMFKFLSDSGELRFENCGSYLLFHADQSKQKRKLAQANFCKNRFCPMCSWRKSLSDAFKIAIISHWIAEKHKKKFVFLTLTVPNVAKNELKESIKELNKSFNRLVMYKEVAGVVKGFVRKLEVTYNENRDDYHPHLHIMIAVNKSYFSNRTYLNHEKWLQLWQKATKNPKITQVDVRAIKNNDDTSFFDAVLEIAKYTAKDSDMLKSEEVFDTFYHSLKGVRLLGYGGLFKEGMDLFKEGKLDYLKEVDETEYIYKLIYRWEFEIGEYQNSEFELLTEDEYSKANKHLKSGGN